MPNFTFPAWMIPLLPKEKTPDKWPHFKYVFAYGGRGGAKSRAFGSYVIARMRKSKIGVLVVREIMGSIKHSSWRVLKNEIERQSLQNEFTVLDNEIRHVNGSYCIFLGVRNNTDQIKGTEGIDLLWGDEATPFSIYSLDILRPTIMRNSGAMAIFSYNPENEDDPIHAWAKSPPEGSLVIPDISLEDNPWATQELYEERAEDYRKDPDKASWIWGGKCISRKDSQVFGGRYRIEEFEPQKEWDGPYFGLDFGFSQDPSHALECYKYGDSIYVRREARRKAVEIDHLPEFLMDLPNSTERALRCDNSRPETISYLQRHGYPKAMGAKKWPKSVEDGVAWLRSHSIVIHPECPFLAEEMRLYRYKVDRLTGDILTEIIDANNHGCDALRYTFEPLIFGRSERPVTTNLSTFGIKPRRF
jgi:phage terminase large subunit